MTRNTIEKTFQKKKGGQQRLKKRFLELPRESKTKKRKKEKKWKLTLKKFKKESKMS